MDLDTFDTSSSILPFVLFPSPSSTSIALSPHAVYPTQRPSSMPLSFPSIMATLCDTSSVSVGLAVSGNKGRRRRYGLGVGALRHIGMKSGCRIGGRSKVKAGQERVRNKTFPSGTHGQGYEKGTRSVSDHLRWPDDLIFSISPQLPARAVSGRFSSRIGSLTS